MPEADPSVEKRLQGLEEYELQLLELVAVVPEPQALSALCGLASVAEICSPKRAKAALNRLAADGLIQRKGQRFSCAPDLENHLVRRLVWQGHHGIAEAAAVAFERPGFALRSWFWDRDQLERELRAALLGGVLSEASDLAHAAMDRFRAEAARLHPYRWVLDRPFDPEWLLRLPDPILHEVLLEVIWEGFCRFRNETEYLGVLEEALRRRNGPRWMAVFLATHYLWIGLPELAEEVLSALEPGSDTLCTLGMIACMRGRPAEGLERFAEAERLLKQGAKGRKKPILQALPSLFQVAALLGTGRREDAAAAEERLLLLKKEKGAFRPVFQRFHRLALQRLGRRGEAEALDVDDRGVAGEHPYDLFGCLALRWDRGKGERFPWKALDRIRVRAAEGGLLWIAAEASYLQSLKKDAPPGVGKEAEEFFRKAGLRPLVELLQPVEPWETALEALGGVADATAPGRPEEAPATRIVWCLELSGPGVYLVVREQKRTRRGKGWTKGRKINPYRHLDRLVRAQDLPPEDERVLSVLLRKAHRYAEPLDYWSGADAGLLLRALVGHPRVAWDDDPHTPIQVVVEEPVLEVTRTRGGCRVRLVPHVPYPMGTVVQAAGPHRIRLVEPGPVHRRVAAVIGSGLTVPASGLEQLREAIAGVVPFVTVRSEVEGVGTGVEVEEADGRVRLRLRPKGKGLTVEAGFRPFGEGGPFVRPGEGDATLVATVAGRRRAVRRDRAAEKRRVAEVLSGCPGLGDPGGDRWEWEVPTTHEALELLWFLHDLGDRIVVEWPEGEEIRVSKPVGPDALRVSVRGGEHWFAVSGEIEVDEGQVVAMREVLEHLREAPGRFVPLGEGRFLALTEAFRRRLEDLDALLERHGRGLRMPSLAAPVLEEVAGEVGGFRTDRTWKEHLERIREAARLEPELPAGFRGELRPYQLEAFRWLCRLAHWGAGACLADDMGLGKTVEALAVIARRAPDGPTLVVAPTSVGPNWAEEARRFTPDLRVHLFSEAGDRKRLLEGLGPRDLVIASYGLLRREADALAGVEWETVVLDEAQAIKNPTALQTRAALRLKGRFRMVLTGTPIENHLGDLWSLFRFLNPGLLGSQKRFRERFVLPIERDGDDRARERLRRIVGPFLLRRTKDQVLKELPPRTETVLRVDLTQKERALYEALRIRALEHLERADDGPEAQKRVAVLAELMRLRRACCHPRLVVPDADLPGSKLEAFGELVEELRENRHRALVFSQFVDHLTVVREYLDARGVPYQYLDGSTPSRQRKRRIDAFQAGEGDLFLISLKAGGTGINLTAADYVIHLDPWWNPAVENQASDRAHRIGQTKPVTIYRLVARGTIEDKIVDLHARKKELAEGILAGSDSPRFSLEELMELLRGGA